METHQARLFEKVPISAVEDFWNSRPCNIRHSSSAIGTKAYFDEVESRKYSVEPHISGFAQFERWAGKRVLEIGCGIGTDTINFARHGALVTAVDLSRESLSVARRRAEVFGLQDRIRFFQCNAEQLTEFVPVEPFDLIYSFGVIHHTPHPEEVLAQLPSYAKADTTVKIMLYHRWSWKALWILFSHGKGCFWRFDKLIAEYSEAQTGCPVTYAYSKGQARRMMERRGFEVLEARIEHIFPYKVSEYVQHRHVLVWYFRILPRPAFRMLERCLGWHLCLTARIANSQAARTRFAFPQELRRANPNCRD